MKKINYITLNHASLDELLNAIHDKGQLYELNKALHQLEESSLMIELGKGNEENYEIKTGNLVVNMKTREVYRHDQPIYLTPKEFDILYFLMTNRGEVFSKEQIYKAVWKEDYYIADSNIMAFIRKLRKKIEYNPDDPQFILTVWGIGYKFNDKLS